MSDVAKCTHDTVSQKLMRKRNEFRDNRSNTALDAGFDVSSRGELPDIALKVRDMHQMGLMRVEPELDEKLGKMHEAIEEYKQLHDKNDEFMTCVWVKPNEVQLHAFDVHYAHRNEPTRVSRGQALHDPSFGRFPTILSRNELPDSVMDKVCVLDVLGIDDFVYDVGIKLSDGVYYIRHDWSDIPECKK